MPVRDADDRVRVRLKAKISPDRPTSVNVLRRGGDEKTRRGGSGVVLARFGRFFAFFEAAGQKVENPLPRELNPRLPLYFGGA